MTGGLSPSGLSYCRGPELVIGDDEPRSLADWLPRAAAVSPTGGVRVLLDAEHSEFVDYPTLLARAGAEAAGLAERGIAPGDHVVLQLPCSLDHFVAVWACVLAGARPVTVARPPDHRTPNPVLDKLLAVWTDLGRPMLLTDDDGLAAAAGGPLAGARTLTLTGAPPGVPPGLSHPYGRSSGPTTTTRIRDDGIALALVSSGSTGRPKIVPLTHRGLLELGVAARERPGFRPGDTTFNWLPLDHSGAFLMYHLAAVFTGATNIHAPTELITADPLRLLDLVQRHEVDHAWWPNFGYRVLTDLIAEHPDRTWDLSSLRVLLNGGEQCTLPVVDAFVAATARFGVSASMMLFTWGMTETTTAITYSRFDDPATVRDGLVGVGTPDPGAELRIVDAAGVLVPLGVAGRLQVRSGRITPGYLNDPAAAQRADAGDGWFATGDLAVMHGDAVTITGRENDLIILNGKNHLANEIEAELSTVDGLAEVVVAACGVPDAAAGTERLVVFVEAPDGAPHESLAGAVRATLAARRHLTDVRVVTLPELPRTTSGKLRRAELRDRFATGEFTPPPTGVPTGVSHPYGRISGAHAATRMRDAVRVRARGAGRVRDAGGARAFVTILGEVLAEVLGREVPVDRPFYELGVSSLHIARVHERLRTRLGRDLPRTALFEHPTVLRLAAHLAGSEPATGPDTAPDRKATPTRARPAGDRRIAIIGLSARFPGAPTLDRYWANLRDGVSSIRRFSPDELPAAADPGFVAAAAPIDGIDEFDAELFGISPRDAALTDPAQRLFLQSCRHAMEHAGYGGAVPGRVGVFAGCGMNLYPGHAYVAAPTDGLDPVAAVQAAIGTQPDFLATRVSYRLGLTGPAMSVQTACSTSLVAVHLAVGSLLAGECELALAGAAAVHVPQVTGYRYADGSILSRSGCCRPFDAAADGTVGGSGVAAVLLKPLDAALADGDTVHAVLLGSAVGNDGAAKVSFTAPSVEGQARTVSDALAAAGVTAGSIGYVEAHGTGTELGDPIEVAALTNAFRRHTDDVAFCGLGSVKANVGHLDSCAGMAGLIKVVLMLRAGEIPPQTGFRDPNPGIELTSSPFVLHTARRPWSTDGAPRRALVGALGVGGTNAHLVVEEAPPPAVRDGHRPLGVLPLSADTPEALSDLADAYREWLRDNENADLADVLVTTAVGRGRHRHRLAGRGSTPHELAASLASAATGHGPAPRVAFCFTGQGGGPADLSHKALCQRFDVFAMAWDEATAGIVAGPGTAGEQPTLFAHEVALATLWRSWGVEPDLVLGHSAGELAAMCVAGALTVSDGARLAAARGRLMQDTEPGGLVAVFADRATVHALLDAVPGTELAVVNGSAHHVLGGPVAAVAALVASLDACGVPYRRLPVSRAFHTAAIDGMLAEFRATLAEVEFRPLSVPLASTVGDAATLLAPGTAPDAEYFVRQAREVVRFDLATAAAGGHVSLEVGPGDVLTRLTRSARALPGPSAPSGPGPSGSGLAPAPYAAGPSAGGWVASLPRGADPLDGTAAAVGELYRLGVPIDWAAVTSGCAGRRVPLPLYPYRRTSHWLPQPGAAQPIGGDHQVTAAAAEVLDVIRELVAEQVGVPPDAVTPDSSFVRLGADSLTMVALVGRLDACFGVRIGMRELFASDSDTAATDTPRGLADLVATRMPPPAPPAASTPTATRPPPPPAAPTTPAPPRPPTTPTAPPITAPTPTARPTLAPPSVPAPAPTPTPTPAPPQPQSGWMAHLAGSSGQMHHSPEAADERTSGHDAAAVHAVLAQQLAVMADFSAVMKRQLDILAAPTAPAALTTPAAPAAPAAPAGTVADPGVAPVEPLPPLADHPALPRPPAGTCDFSVYFFGDYPDHDKDGENPDRYRSVMDTVAFADEHGFHAVWLPERHFHSFGGIFPNPSVLAAALASRTTRIRLHAGSVVLPLHHPVRVAEEWSVVDNLSGGRAGICVASGWHANDFVLRPQNYGPHKDVMYRDLDAVRTLWTGGAVTARSGSGEDVEVRLHPRPVQAMPPLYAAIVGNPHSYRQAGERGLGVVTNLMTQTVDALAENLRIYRAARRDVGLDPDTGRVVVLLHTFLDDDADAARREAFEPFCRYLRSSLSLFGGVTNSLGFDIDLDRTPEDDVRFLLEQAYDRYCASRALIGSPDSVAPTVDALLSAGANEVACFVDFGLAPELLRDGLPAMDRLRRRYAPSTVDAVDTDSAPLSSAQQRMWILHEMFPDRPMYNEPRAIGLDGDLDLDALRAAVTAVVAAHPALRTVFRTVGGEPRQIVPPAGDVDCPLVDHTGHDEDAVVRDVMARESRRRFDLAAGPTLVACLLRFSPTRHVLVLSVHHIVSDGLSWVVLFRDLAACYRAARDGTAAELAPQRISYLEYARAQRSTVDGDDLRFWVDRLRDVPTVLELPADRPRPAVMGGDGRSFFVHLDAALTGRLREFARGRGVTPFMALLGGYAAMLSAFTGQRRLVLGAAVANRPPGTENTVGMFVDTLPLPIDLTGDPTFAELLARIRIGTAEAYDHARVPFDELVAELNPRRDPSRNPIFQVMVEYENDSGSGFELPGLTATLLEVAPQKAPFDLTCYLANLADTVQCHVEYNADLFDEATVRRFLAHFAHLLDVAVAEPDVPLSHLPPITTDDAALLESLQGKDTKDSAAEPALLHARFVEHAAAHPDAVAVDGTATLTYRELDEHANRLTWVLRGRGVGAGDVVAISLPPGPDLVVAILAVLKAGGGYLPIDPAATPARSAFQLKDGGAAVLITAGSTDLTADTVLRMDDLDDAEPAAASTGVPPDVATPDTLAYLIYTSGSTGRPKGVAMPHRGPSSVVGWYVAAHTPMRTLQWTSCAFDVSVLEILATLSAGGTVMVAPPEVRYDPRALVRWVRDHGVQRIGMPFTPLKYLAEALADDPEVPSLREIVTIGEALRLTPALRALLAANPQCRLYNEYGPTETSVIVTSHAVDPDGPAAPPIGRLVDGVRGYVLDDTGRPVPVGATGELHLAGPFLADGYLGRPAQTAAAFVPDPFGTTPGGRLYRTGDLVRHNASGALEFLGRIDDQVKIRGHRVEPGEVSAVLRELPEVADAAVLVRTDRGDEPYLAAYVVPAAGIAGTAPPAADLAARLSTHLSVTLPDHMVPRAWVVLPELPVSTSGKLDRARLPEPNTTATATATAADPARPLTADELTLHELWRAELGDAVDLGQDTEFFAVGGHSLNAIRLLTRVREEFGQEYPVLRFFQAPTIRAMAEKLDAARPGRVRGTV